MHVHTYYGVVPSLFDPQEAPLCMCGQGSLPEVKEDLTSSLLDFSGLSI